VGFSVLKAGISAMGMRLPLDFGFSVDHKMAGNGPKPGDFRIDVGAILRDRPSV
jgi:hypothetical protein